MKLEKNTYKIPSARGPRLVSLTSLRPGDWLRYQGVHRSFDCYVIQNWPSLKRLEVMWPDKPFVAHYDTVVTQTVQHWTYLGRGQKRQWVAKLPAALKKLFACYSKP